MRKLKKWCARWVLRKGRWDWEFALLVGILLVMGLVMLFSASYPSALYETGDSAYYFKRQCAFVGIGLAAMWAVSRVDYHWFRRNSRVLMLAAVILLALVLAPQVGELRNNARRWMVIFGVSFQPSEFAKLALIAEFSAMASRKTLRDMKTLRYGVGPFAVCGIILTVLMMAEPHFSGTVILAATGAIILFAAGLGWAYIAGGVVLGGGVIRGLMSGVIPYGQDRIAMWRDPFVDATGLGYQLSQSLITIGSGGLMGAGLGRGLQKFLYLPEESNDFIFAVICEELGLIGATLILLVFTLLIIRGYMIARHAPDRFGALLVTGVVSQIAMETFFNVAVVTGLVPTTGISLPFFSYGGSAMLFLLIEVGIVLSVTRVIDTRKGEENGTVRESV